METRMERVNLAPVWERIWARRRGIAVLALAASLLAGVIAFLSPPWYRADASLMPPSEESPAGGIASLLRGFGVPGVRIPTQVTPADVFISVLESRRINEEIVTRFDLVKRYDVKILSDALKELRSHVRFELLPSGTIRISVEDRDAQIAAEMANAYVDCLDRFSRETRMTKGRRTREFVEKRLAETKRELEGAEDSLRRYQSRHKAVALSAEASAAIDAAARLYAERTALQVRLGVVRSYSREASDEELQIRQQLAQLDRQLQRLPGTGLDMARLLRDVKTLEQVYVLLMAQYEDARIDEARDVVTVQQLDVARPPERKSRPRRLLMVGSACLLGVGVGVAHALARPPHRAGNPG